MRKKCRFLSLSISLNLSLTHKLRTCFLVDQEFLHQAQNESYLPPSGWIFKNLRWYLIGPPKQMLREGTPSVSPWDLLICSAQWHHFPCVQVLNHCALKNGLTTTGEKRIRREDKNWLLIIDLYKMYVHVSSILQHGQGFISTCLLLKHTQVASVIEQERMSRPKGIIVLQTAHTQCHVCVDNLTSIQ